MSARRSQQQWVGLLVAHGNLVDIVPPPADERALTDFRSHSIALKRRTRGPRVQV
jgi:hypothetical protein